MEKELATLANAAQIVMMFATIIGAALVFFQIHAARRDQRESTAKSVYHDYLKLAFENPHFANPESKIISDFEYRWFAAIVLNSCEEILVRFPKNLSWEKVVAAELEYHHQYLDSDFFKRSDEDRGWSLYSPELKLLYEKYRPSFGK